MSAPESGALRAMLAGARRLGFRYECYRILQKSLLREEQTAATALPPGFRLAEVTSDDVGRSRDVAMRECDWYGGSGALGFALLDAAGDIACLQWYWSGERYRSASFWDVPPTAAVSMHLVTLPAHRNRGLASALKAASAHAMAARGFTALYSRIWWTNAPSLRVSEKTGWQRVGTTLRIVVPWREAPLSFRWRDAPAVEPSQRGRT